MSLGILHGILHGLEAAGGGGLRVEELHFNRVEVERLQEGQGEVSLKRSTYLPDAIGTVPVG